jgi:ribonuclease HI
MAIGFVMEIDDSDVCAPTTFGCKLGSGTNNRAEYLALIFALREALRQGVTHLEVLSDSQLMVNQVNGRWDVNGHLKDLHEEACGLLKMFTAWTLRHVSREENTDADFLSKHPTTDPLPSTSGVEITPFKRARKLTRQQAAMVRWWWKTGRCRNEYRLARIFGGAPSHMGRIGRGEQYKDITAFDLPGTRLSNSLVGAALGD